MTSPIERIVYRSDAVALADSPVDVSRILSTSVRNNARARLTGALALQGGTFVHVLEGDPETLTGLMETIEADDRHRNLRVLARWPVQVQLFLGWAMVHVDTRVLSPHHSRLLTQTGSGAQVTSVLIDLARARLDPVVQALPPLQSAQHATQQFAGQGRSGGAQD